MKKLILFFWIMTALGFAQANLTALSPSATYGGLLHFGNNTGVSSSLLPVYDGLGNALPLQISTTGMSTRYIQTSQSSNYSILTTDRYVDCTGGSGGITVTLPTAVGYAGLTYTITKVDAAVGYVTIATTSSQTINGNATYSILMQYSSVTLHSNGSNWIIN